VDDVGTLQARRKWRPPEEIPPRIEGPDGRLELLHPEVADPPFGRALVFEPCMEQADVEGGIPPGHRRNEVSDVGPDPTWGVEPQLIDVDGDARHLGASTHSTPIGPTVAACSVRGAKSSRSPAPISMSPLLVWKMIEPVRQNSTL